MNQNYPSNVTPLKKNTGVYHPDAPHPIKRVPTVGIVGFGPSGFLLVADEVKRRRQGLITNRLIYKVFEPSGRPALGVAWSTEPTDDLWVNMMIDSLQVDDDARRIQREMGFAKNQKFAKRASVGEWLTKYWQLIKQMAPTVGVDIQMFEQSVIDLSQNKEGQYEMLAESGIEVVDTVVLALGQMPPTNYKEHVGKPSFISNPWNYRATGKESSTLILGAGLTSIDTTIGLLDAGHQSTVVWAGRSGKTPWVRPRMPELDIHLSEQELEQIATAHDGHLPLDIVKGLIIHEFKCQGVSLSELTKLVCISRSHPIEALRAGLMRTQREEAYFAVLKAVDYLIPKIWYLLKDEDRDEFFKIYPQYSFFSYAIPEITAQKLLYWLESGRVKIVSGEWQLGWETDCFTLKRKNRYGVVETERFQTVFNATGIARNIREIDMPLITNLVGKGTLVPHPYGGAQCDFETGQILDYFKNPVRGLYVLNGTLNSGVRMLTNEMYEIAKQSARTSLHISQSIHQNEFYDAKIPWSKVVNSN